MEYDLYSIKWDDIELLHNEHLTAETLYVEQMHRWALQYGRARGVIHIGENDFQVYSNGRGYEIALRYCRAITSKGYIVCIDADSAVSLQGSNDRHQDSLVPVYLGVCVVKQPANAGSSQSGALLDRPVLRWAYKLSTDPDDVRYAWLQVGRLRRDGQQFVRDERYIPQCVYLKSHPALMEMAKEITRMTETALQVLERAYANRQDGQEVSAGWHALIGLISSTLAPAASLIDYEIHPHAYLQMLATMMRTCGSLMVALPNQEGWASANDRVMKVLRTLGIGIRAGDRQNLINVATMGPISTDSAPMIRLDSDAGTDPACPSIFWWDVFDDIRQAIQALTMLFQAMTPVIGATKEGGSVIRQANVSRVKKI